MGPRALMCRVGEAPPIPWGNWPRMGLGVAQGPTLACVASSPSAMAKFAGPRLPLVMKVLLGTHSSVYEAQRVTSTAFLAEVGAACSDGYQGPVPGMGVGGGSAPIVWCRLGFAQPPGPCHGAGWAGARR